MPVMKSVCKAVLGLVVGGLCGCDGGDSAPASNPASAPDVAGVALATAEWGTVGAGNDLDTGRDLFMSTCSACHGASAQGMPNQGPDLRRSPLISRSSDADLVAFVARGRTPGEPGSMMGLPMPPRGGNAALSDRHLGLIARYLRLVQAQPTTPDTESSHE